MSLSSKDRICFLLYVFNELKIFLSEIETDNLDVSNGKIITFDFTVSRKGRFI